jgi:Cd2+/Zn2+-exporting ATPase
MPQTRYYIAAMDCPTEEQIIRNGLKSHPAVERLDFDLINRILTVTHPPAADAGAVRDALDKLGRAAQLAADPGSIRRAQEENARAARRKWLWLGLSGALAAAAEVIAWATGRENGPLVIGIVLLSVALGGRDTFRKGLTALRTLTLNINFLMTLAVVGAVIVGQWPEAAMVTFLFGVAEQIESYSLERARDAISALVKLAPETASVWHAHAGEGEPHWHDVPAVEVRVGQRVRVRPGERVPLDGTVVEGRSAVDQAPITGESIPVEKERGDAVFAGTVNGRGLLVFEVTAAAGATTLDRIARAVRDAQSEKAPTQRFVDRFAAIYTPAVVGLACLVAVAPPLLVGGSWSAWLYKALVLLVIACPCALVISTPVTVVSALAAAARRGILVKGGAYLEQGKNLKLIALDKTGTLTKGRPVVTDIVPLGDGSPEYLLHLAASLDAGSEHPVASAIVTSCAGAHPDGETCVHIPVTEFEALVGRGVTGKLDGKRYYVGNHRLTHENEVCGPHVETILERLERDGKTPVILTDDEEALAVLAVADTLRETSIEAVSALHAMGVRTVMLSGDNPRTAAALARQVGVDDARGDLLPEDKLAAVSELLGEYGATAVGMVGDGINDAPALARAAIGFAMGAAGTDTALETADVALMEDDLRKLPLFLQLSRTAGAVLAQNIALAIGIKAVFFALALAGKATLWMAVFADLGTSLLVIGNGLRLLRFGATPGQAVPGPHQKTPAWQEGGGRAGNR